MKYYESKANEPEMKVVGKRCFTSYIVSAWFIPCPVLIIVDFLKFLFCLERSSQFGIPLVYVFGKLTKK